MAAPGKPPDEGLAGAVRASLLEAGAAQVGFADLEPIPPEARRGFPRGVAFLRPLDPAVVAQLRDGPTAAYHQEYERANAELTRLAHLAAELLRRAGHRAEPTAPATVRVVAGACREQVEALTGGRGIDVLICGICIHACPWTQRHLARQGAGR